MAHADRTFTFASDLEGWVAGGATHANLTLSRTTAEGQADGACLQARLTGKNNNPGQSWWEWTGTWEDLGVTAGHEVTQVNGSGSFWSRCSEFTTGHANNNVSGPLEVRDSAGDLIGTLSAAGLEIAGVNAWTEVTSTAVAIPDHPSNTTIRLRMNVSCRTGSSTSAAVTIRQDTVLIVSTHAAAATVHDLTGSISGSGTLSGTLEIVTPAQELTGSISGVGSMSGDLGLRRVLEGSVAGVGSLSGSLTATRALTGSISGVGSLDGTLTIVETGFDPADADVTINGTTAELTWSASPTPGVVDYQVFRRTPQTGDPFDPEVDTPVATGITDLFYDDENLDPGDFDWQVFGRVPA